MLLRHFQSAFHCGKGEERHIEVAWGRQAGLGAKAVSKRLKPGGHEGLYLLCEKFRIGGVIRDSDDSSDDRGDSDESSDGKAPRRSWAGDSPVGRGIKLQYAHGTDMKSVVTVIDPTGSISQDSNCAVNNGNVCRWKTRLTSP